VTGSGGPHPELRAAPAHVFVAHLDHPELEEDDAHHLTRVMRLRDGAAVGLSDGAGRWRTGRLTLGAPTGAGPGAGARRAGIEPDGPITADPAPEPAVSLAVALPKGDRGDWAVQKLTELGVDEIIVLDAARSVVRWDEDRASRGMARLSRIIRQAAMQARLTRLPRLAGPLTVARVAADPGVACAGAEPGAANAPDLAHPRVLIGPEGGWAEGEVPAGVARVGLGPTVLRTETAAVAAATVLVLLRAGLLN